MSLQSARTGMLAALALATASVVGAQGLGQAPRAASESRSINKVATAARTTETPTIDGVLDDHAWSGAPVLGGFVQAEPLEGEPATETTEVRLLYDDQAIYVGVVCYDAEPSKIITTDARRDPALSNMDSFQVILDTYHDRQNGFIFGTNATGSQYDAQVRSEGETQSSGAPTLGRTSTGSGGGVNVNWDASWQVKVRVSEIGWTAEFRIPLRTLRYGPSPQVWGLNFARTIRRKREEDYWSPVARIYNLTRLSSAGELRDLELKTPRNLKLMPYAISSANRNFTPGSTSDLDGDWGIDAKVGVTSSMNLDLTYNTDFAQVEVDEQQINLTRFNLLFPEKRPFFLENRGLFAVGKNGEIDVFFSRRIGITDSGALVPIKGGVRLTGKARGVNMGLLDMQTDAAGTAAANNFVAARVSKDLPNRSSVGAIFVNRTATGRQAGTDNWNRSWGADAKWGMTEAVTFNAFAARTKTPGLVGHDYAYNTGLEFKNRQTRTFLAYTEVGENFNPEVGFLERSDAYRQVGTGWFQNVRSRGLARVGLREWRPHVSYESYWGFDGFQETALLHMDNTLDWEAGHSLSPALNIQYEGLREPFEVYPGVIVPPGSYRSPYLALNSSTDSKRWLSGGVLLNIGGFLSGHQNSMAPNVTIQRGGRFTTTLRWTRNAIDLPQGSFTTDLASLRTTFNFTTLVNGQGLIQYNDRTKRWSTNLRFNWQQTAATGLYVVYNDTEAFNGLGPVNRAFIVKYSYMVDVLR